MSVTKKVDALNAPGKIGSSINMMGLKSFVKIEYMLE